ncbi:MAG: efflux RND transporter permease subunit [Planctomycetes bacterium]|nr:efflux RND transporter permease subunit [Planctomycetota bacterium]
MASRKVAIVARAGLTPQQIGTQLRIAQYGQVTSYILKGDRRYGVRVIAADSAWRREQDIARMPIRSAKGKMLTVADVADIHHDPGILEMHREDLRQHITVSARFSGIDLGHGIQAIKDKLAAEVTIPEGVIVEYGGTFQQQQESFRNLTFVLIMAIVLVYAVLLLEFRSLLAPLAIVLGAALALFGVVVALWLTGTSFNIVSFLGAIIGVGIVAKNGILMMDYVVQLREKGLSLIEALVQSGRRRLRPVLMTSLTTFLGLLPLAYGLGAGADMLKPLAISVIGALSMSLLLSLVATPVCYYLLMRLFRQDSLPAASPASVLAANNGETP